MEQRGQKRIAVGYKAEIIFNGKSYECVIENLSATGVNIVTSPNDADFRPHDDVELKFEPRPGETISLKGRIMWSRKTMPHRLTTRLGLEFIDPAWNESDFFV